MQGFVLRLKLRSDHRHSFSFTAMRSSRTGSETAAAGGRSEYTTLRNEMSETILAVVVLCFTFASVFEDPAALTQQRRLCTLARASLQILLAGDDAVRLADRCDSVLEELQVLRVQEAPCPAESRYVLRQWLP